MGLPHAGGLAAQAGGRTQPLAGPGPGSEPRWSRQDGAGRPAGAAAPCEAGLRPTVCERSGVRVPPVEEACDITPSWLLAGGDPTPGFLPSGVSCDLAEGAKGQNGDAGGAGPPAGALARADAHVWSPPAGRPGAGRSAAGGVRDGDCHVRGFRGARTPSRPAEPGLLGRPRRAAPGFPTVPTCWPCACFGAHVVLGAPRGRCPCCQQQRVGLGAPPPGAVRSRAGCGLRAASGGGRCLGTHSDLRPVSVCEWCPRPVSPVAGPQPSAELAAGPRSGAARRGPEPRTPAPAVSGTGPAVRARGPGSWAALGMAGGEGSPAPDETFRAPVSSPRHSEPGTAPQACSPLQGALSVGVGQAHSQLTPGPLQAPQSPRGGLSLGVAGLLVTSYRPLWDRVCCWAGHSEVTIRVWVCLPAGPPGTLPGSPHPPPPARDMQLDPPCW